MPAANYNEYMRAYMLKRYHERKSEAQLRLGGKCFRCGTTETLEFDHIDPKDKSFTLGSLWSCSVEKFNQELSKCQLLCKICHIEKSKIDVGVPHGGGVAGKFIRLPNGKRGGCPCALCKAKKNEYQKRYKASLRERAADPTGLLIRTRKSIAGSNPAGGTQQFIN